jgi:hypothetical protein
MAIKPPPKTVTPTPVKPPKTTWPKEHKIKTPPGTGKTKDDPYGGLTGDDRDAAVALTNMFNSYDLGSLSGTIIKYIQNGYSADTISILLQDTPAYKQRFAANTARLKAGLPVLSPAEYISTERSYRQVMQSAGLPIGFYDQTSDFQKFLESDVSPTEVQSRVATVSEAINKAPAATKDYFKQWYSTGDMIAYALDPTKAAPLIDEKIKSAEAAALAQQQGFNLSRQNAELIGNTGATLDNIQAGIGTVGGDLANATKLAGIYGVDYSEDDLVKEVFTNDAAATNKRKGLASQERATFAGGTGQTTGSLSKNGAGSI